MVGKAKGAKEAKGEGGVAVEDEEEGRNWCWRSWRPHWRFTYIRTIGSHVIT